MQYLLALDRTNERVAHLISRFIAVSIRSIQSQRWRLKTTLTPTICGELAGEIEFAPILSDSAIPTYQ